MVGVACAKWMLSQTKICIFQTQYFPVYARNDNFKKCQLLILRTPQNDNFSRYQTLKMTAFKGV